VVLSSPFCRVLCAIAVTLPIVRSMAISPAILLGDYATDYLVQIDPQLTVAYLTALT
jgi:ABC-type methionine transport system ATPase subunit